jgi:hypothetical protein
MNPIPWESHSGCAAIYHIDRPYLRIASFRQTTPITRHHGEQNVTFALPYADRVYLLVVGA